MTVSPGWIPYETVGKVAVAVLGVVGGVVLLAVLAFWVLFLWVRFWNHVVRLAWRGYDPVDEPPPGIRRRIAIVAWGLSKLKRPSEVHDAIKAAHERDEM